MIAVLRGRVLSATLGEVVVDVGGVGFAVRVAPGTVVTAAGGEVTLHTYLAVREDALTLYGFHSPTARDLFTTLLGVTGVGPKVALAALGTLGEDGIRRAVVGEDVNALTIVPGVGRKGAQRMVLELREKLGAPGSDGVPGGAGPGGGASARAEVAEALSALGYGAAEVARALDQLDPRAEAPPEALLRDALRGLGSRA